MIGKNEKYRTLASMEPNGRVTSDRLRSFVAIAECQNLTLAAGQLNRTQSAISAQLKALEDGLGVRLFERGAKGMRLTAEGERLLPRARAVVREVTGLAQLFADPLEGQIHVGIPDDFEDGRLEHVLADFAASHPGVEVRVASGCTASYPRQIAEGRLDLAVQSLPAPTEGRVIATEPILWAAGPGCNLGAPLPLAVLDRACWWRRLPEDALGQAGRPFRPAFVSASFASVRAAISAGLAVGILPAHLHRQPPMRVLGAKEGFPPLPDLCQTLLVRPGAQPDLTQALKTALLRHAPPTPGRSGPSTAVSR
ncbi:MAG: LysR substrate-binding domain-containing protein [Pseudomonadota bacterium]